MRRAAGVHLRGRLTATTCCCTSIYGLGLTAWRVLGWQVEGDYLPLYKNYGLGLTTWSPLASRAADGQVQQGPRAARQPPGAGDVQGAHAQGLRVRVKGRRTAAWRRRYTRCAC